MSGLPIRKRNRLNGYNYSRNGYYFITICTKDRQLLLCDINNNNVHLSDYGNIVNKYILSSNSAYTYLHIDNYVIMPNHIHFIINIEENIDYKKEMTHQLNNNLTNVPSTVISKFVSTFKHLTIKESGVNFWQRNYHDHIIRNEDEYIKIDNYINYNPNKWESDCHYLSK